MSINSDIARDMYVNLRKKVGCPPITCRLFREGYYSVESQDGKVIMEDIKANNAWEAKFKCVQEWFETQPYIHHCMYAGLESNNVSCMLPGIGCITADCHGYNNCSDYEIGTIKIKDFFKNLKN